MLVRKILGAAVLTLGAIGTVSAQGWEPHGRFGIGGVRLEIKADDYALEGRSHGWEIFGGFEFNRWLAIEFGYIDGGKATERNDIYALEVDSQALTASVVGSLPLNEYVSVFLRGGALHWKADHELRENGTAIVRWDADSTDPFVGAGAAVVLDGALIRLEYRVADLDDSDIEALLLNVAWRF